MLYRLVIIFVFSSFLSGQSLFNRWVGTDPFTGSARSTSMGNTHLLNSSGSANTRFNPTNLTSLDSRFAFDVQIDRLSIFERWSIPTKNNFGDFLTYSDYVANEFSYYGFRGGITVNTKLFDLGRTGLGAHYAPLSHFTYHYVEEVGGVNQIEDGATESKDPNVGYQNLSTDGSLMVSSIGGGIKLNAPDDIALNIGGAINFIQSTKITDQIGVDTLYSDVTNLSTYSNIHQTEMTPESDFMTLSIKFSLKSFLEIAASWESKTTCATKIYDWSIDSTSGLLQYWDDSTYEDSTFYAVKGINYVKPELKSLAINYIADSKQTMSISFELNEVVYNNHQILQNYSIYKFGFEYITQSGTPIRGGLVYRTAILRAMSPVSTFTFGTGKKIGNLIIDAAGTYRFYSFSYPDLFPVEGDNRPDFDLVRESQLQLQLALSYRF